MELRFRRYDLKLAYNWMVASSQTTGGKMIYPAVLVELRDHDGVIGYGEAAPSNRYHETADTCLAFL
ncbi:MAG: dipeptide epimerase, partial [Chthoniobacterales bacterium]